MTVRERGGIHGGILQTDNQRGARYLGWHLSLGTRVGCRWEVRCLAELYSGNRAELVRVRTHCVITDRLHES